MFYPQDIAPKQKPQRLVQLLYKAVNSEKHSRGLYSRLIQLHGSQHSCAAELCTLALHEDETHCRAMEAALSNLIKHRFTTYKNSLPPHQPALRSYTPPVNATPRQLLQNLVQIEAASIHAYQEICALTLEYDYQIFDVSYRNMNNNSLHLQMASNLLGPVKK